MISSHSRNQKDDSHSFRKGKALTKDQILREEITNLHAHVCSGLADPIRIMILYSLAEKDYNVTELANTLEVPQPTISRHLQVLRDRSMVNAQRDGQSVYYSLADQRIIQALNLLRGLLADTLKNQSDLARSAAERINTDS